MVRTTVKSLFTQLFHKTYQLPKARSLSTIVESFSFSERIVFALASALLLISTISVLAKVNTLLVVDTPVRGGSLTEGIIGTPRFINPLLAITDADRDLTQLIYSGLMKSNPDGSLTPDLAESYVVSEDGRSYTFTIRENAMFHDGTHVTADDIIFTITKAQDPMLRSPKRVNWDGVAVEKVNEREVRFTLARPYAPFLENTTLGILPKHIWNDIDTEQFPFNELNTDPIGSGPYRVGSIKRNSTNVPTAYTLKPFDAYTLGAPFIANLSVVFYSNEDLLIEAFEDKDIDTLNSISPQRLATLDTDATQYTVPLPRVFGVFFNQNEANIFTDLAVRKALDTALDKEALVDAVLYGYGEPLNGPIPPGILPNTKTEENVASSSARIEEALDILTRNGWTFNDETGVMQKKGGKELRFSIATSNIPELKQAAEIVIATWQKLGAQVELKVFDPVDLNQTIIRTRRYDALLFGTIIGRDLDFFAFWHSSQRNDPGLNIALYTNSTVDDLLDDARKIQDKTERLELYKEFNDIITEEFPATFLYAPDFVYLLDASVHNVILGQITTPSDRFINVHEWFIDTEKVWSIFK